MMKTRKALLGILFLILWGLTFTPSTALAHGEKALEPFIRMRTIQWYDVMWSKDKLNVNDEVVITGKFHVAEDWPRGVPKPDAAYLNVSSPGPVFVRTERYLNGPRKGSTGSFATPIAEWAVSCCSTTRTANATSPASRPPLSQSLSDADRASRLVPRRKNHELERQSP